VTWCQFPEWGTWQGQGQGQGQGGTHSEPLLGNTVEVPLQEVERVSH